MDKLSSSQKMPKPKPIMSLDEHDLPTIKDWQVGKTYKVVATVKMTFQSDGAEYEYPDMPESQKAMKARFKIISISPTKEGPKKKEKILPRVKSK